VSFPVRVQARASRDELAGERAGALLLRLKAPPVAGAANAALLRLLAESLGAGGLVDLADRGEAISAMTLEMDHANVGTL